MSFKDEITKGIGAHGLWKARLHAAIDSGKVDDNIADVHRDNVCSFGQWLYGASIPAEVRGSSNYAQVRNLHADFHQCAGKVLMLTKNGKKNEAEAMMGTSGEFTRISGDLTHAMMEWQRTVKA